MVWNRYGLWIQTAGKIVISAKIEIKDFIMGYFPDYLGIISKIGSKPLVLKPYINN